MEHRLEELTYHQRYYLEHKEEMKAKRRALVGYDQEYYEKNKEIIKEKRRARYALSQARGGAVRKYSYKANDSVPINNLSQE